MSTPEGYSSIPREEEEGGAGSEHVSPTQQNQKDQGLFAKLHSWYERQWSSGGGSENAPLINRNRMTLEPPRKRKMRIIFEIVSIVGAFTIIAAIIVFSVAGTDDVGGKGTEKDTPTFFFLAPTLTDFLCIT